MARLAIKGHTTRGGEVIALLEMVGGKNNDCSGKNIYAVYAIPDNGYIYPYQYAHHKYPDDFIIFTLEEFLEKFPYKVGDKVTHNMGILMNVVHMRWDAECNVIRYDIQSPVDNNYNLKAMLAEHLQPYKEETMERKDYNPITLIPVLDKVMIIPTDEESEIIQENNKFYLVKKQPRYQKTYEECCEVLDYEPDRQTVTGYNAELIENFQTLKLCRDAYWKIAGDWKPDWNTEEDKYTIYTSRDIIVRHKGWSSNYILAFPTEEMRDAFYENFKELIETVKELL